MINLFDFQKEDVDYLELQYGALIANDMGTGKTYEAIERDRRIREKIKGGDTLVIAPLTTLDSTWRYHFETLTNLWVVVVDPKDRVGSWKTYMNTRNLKGAHGVFCVHWEALRLMPELAKWQWSHIIADECHKAKNRKAQQTRALKTIPAVWKTAMSGTPVVNRPDELWSILNWLYPKTFRSYWKFFNNFVEVQEVPARGGRYVKVPQGPKNVQELQGLLKPFFVRRRKKDVLRDLPDKYYTELKVDLTPTQRKAYESMKRDMIAWVGEQQEEILAAPVVIAQLTRLQQFAVSYAELSPEGRVRLTEPSSKLDLVMELLDETDEQVVVFSRFKQLASLLGDRLAEAKISYVSLTGATLQQDREPLVSKFQRGDARVFIGTIAAGGVGITLHAASRVIFTDRDWSPALNSQAEDRLHRIGQKNAVQVIDIVARNTVDAGRNQKLELKKDMIRKMLGDPEA